MSEVKSEESEQVVDPARQVAQRIEEMAPADAAVEIEQLPADEAAAVAEYLDPTTAARVMARLDSAVAAVIVSAMKPPEASSLLERMNPDDRVDLLENVPGVLHDEIMGEMAQQQADEVRQLAQYPPDTAGGIMTTQVTALYEYISVEDAVSTLRALSQELEQMYYVYVIDSRKHLVGVLSMRDLILAPADKPLREIMITTVRSVPATMDQEAVADLMRRHNYLAMPVVDDGGRLIGLITLDDILRVVEEEATEDVQRLFGAGAEERLTSSWAFSFRKRIFWLEINLITAFLAASVVGFFETTIERVAIIAMYMPVVAGMGGNASAQAMAVAIRGIALGEVDRKVLRHLLKRELIVGVLAGLVVGVTAFVVSLIFHLDHGIMLGVLAGAALWINLSLACLWGVTIPMVMKKLGFDPAQSATIFTTTLTDVLGFFTLLGLAYLFMPWLNA